MPILAETARGTSEIRRQGLAWLQEGHGMEFSAGKVPTDAVTSVHPKLIRQKGESLTAQVQGAVRDNAGWSAVSDSERCGAGGAARRLRRR